MIVCDGKSHIFSFLKNGGWGNYFRLDISNKEIEKFAERGHSIVVLDRTTEHRNIRQVLLDNRGGATGEQFVNVGSKSSSAFWTRKVMIAKKDWLLVHEN